MNKILQISKCNLVVQQKSIQSNLKLMMMVTIIKIPTRVVAVICMTPFALNPSKMIATHLFLFLEPCLWDCLQYILCVASVKLSDFSAPTSAIKKILNLVQKMTKIVIIIKLKIDHVGMLKMLLWLLSHCLVFCKHHQACLISRWMHTNLVINATR